MGSDTRIEVHRGSSTRRSHYVVLLRSVSVGDVIYDRSDQHRDAKVVLYHGRRFGPRVKQIAKAWADVLGLPEPIDYTMYTEEQDGNEKEQEV